MRLFLSTLIVAVAGLVATGLRFFDQFFPGNQEPVRIAALNEQGNVIARQSL